VECLHTSLGSAYRWCRLGRIRNAHVFIHTRGGKSHLTRPVARAITKAFRAGGTMPAASAAAGISTCTLRRWLARGVSEEAGSYRALQLSCQQAAAAYDAKFTARVSIADPEDLVGTLPALESGLPEALKPV
jgi:hypothetical protein